MGAIDYDAHAAKRQNRFQDFFRVLARRDKRIPYRISFLLENGGLNMGLKPLLSSYSGIHFRRQQTLQPRSGAYMRELDLEGAFAASGSAFAYAWATVARKRGQSAFAFAQKGLPSFPKLFRAGALQMYLKQLAIRLRAFPQLFPAIMPSSPAPVTAAPLQDAIGMWPLRPASPWKEGSLLFRTQDGKTDSFCAQFIGTGRMD